MTQNELYLVLGANGLISFAMLAIGVISYLRTRRFLSNAVETRGIVTASEYKGQSSEDGGSMYSPKIRFTDSIGKQYEFTENWSSNRPDFNVGDEVIVLYDPANPQKARRGGNKWKFYFITWLLGGLGLLFSGILVIVIVVMFIVGFPVK